MVANPHFEFLADLAKAFNAGKISLPSFPDIVLRIRKTLEKEDVYIEQVSQVVKTDPMLVSRLLVFANSTAYNPSGTRIDTLEVALNRLGFDLVRSTAVSMAVRQMFLAEQHKEIAPALRKIWQKSMQIAAMCAAVVDNRRSFKEESAFMCGLLHYVGKLYIIKEMKNYPALLRDPVELKSVLTEWHPKVGKCIVESWDFSSEVAQTLDAKEYMSEYNSKSPTLADVVYVAKILLRHIGVAKKAGVDPRLAETEFVPAEIPAMQRLGIEDNELPLLYQTFDDKLSAIREALAS
ncbi:MAG: HDOD domain-containing protein [Woeseia sp.]|nr:HDOD domain-containing protein [Woeseia sp.]MBT8096511.1 HDOD domain-containing protein [Woeseia sp.]NNE62021.1 HDOD domain-containing protein [Woeseia sp.]NNL54998.1 HDOD domain-containing protein [Woeseia sp.]